MVLFIHIPTHRSLFVLVRLCVPRTAAVPCRFCSARFLLWSRRKNKYHYACKIETGFLCGDGARVILCFARVIERLIVWTQKRQANVDACYVRCRAERTSLGPGLEHQILRLDARLAAKRRADARHVVLIFNKTPETSTGAAAALCVLSHDT